MKVEEPKEKYDQLIADGYCVIKNVLKEEMLNRLRTVTDELLDAQTEDERDAYRSSGSMISVYMHPLFAELVVYPRALQALDALGFLRPKWSSGYVISKPPQSPTPILASGLVGLERSLQLHAIAPTTIPHVLFG